MPFVHLERELWDLRDSGGAPIPANAPERGSVLHALGAHGRLHPAVEALLAEPGTLTAAVRLLLDEHFTPALDTLICEATGLDGTLHAVPGRPRRPRRAGFAEEVLQAYAYACAFCGFDGMLGRNPVGLEAAHVRWHSQDGPDEVGNGLALCSLHHTLFDLGVLGLLPDLRIQVSELYSARGAAGQAVEDLHGRAVATPGKGRPAPGADFVLWHGRQVFRRPGTRQTDGSGSDADGHPGHRPSPAGRREARPRHLTR